MEYKVIRKIAGHDEMQNEMTRDSWPEFMFHDAVTNKYWKKLFEYFDDFQVSLSFDNELVGVANTIPISFVEEMSKLPEKGWDWAFGKGIEDHENGRKPNILCGLQIAVNTRFRGKGISTLLLKEMFATAATYGFNKVIIPVRPNLKPSYPISTIDDYINWKRDDDLPFDPWLRVHIRAGGTIVKACHEAMNISGTIAEWEEWTKMKFFQTGKYVIPGALVPVNIDMEKDLGEYVEPNVWILHEI